MGSNLPDHTQSNAVQNPLCDVREGSKSGKIGEHKAPNGTKEQKVTCFVT